MAIIGGGPAGSTVASLIRKYRPDLEVCVFERENFPREHVGESHLPVISHILDEMGVWEKVEEAHFPIKVGASLKW
ncbi:tryptophan 7-halogenase, partial [Acinetobacter baumannii]